MGVLAACVSVRHVRVCCHGNQWRVLDTLELVLQVVVSHHVGPGSGTWVLTEPSHQPHHVCLRET